MRQLSQLFAQQADPERQHSPLAEQTREDFHAQLGVLFDVVGDALIAPLRARHG